jgi:sec-independent protein translocase protein TatA
MPFIGGGHLWLVMILLVVVLIIWGPGKLPDIGSGLGRAIREFRRASSETHDTPGAANDPAPPPLT